MKLFHSNKTYEELLQDMQKDGYSQNYIKCINCEIRWMENHQGVYHFDSFEAACQIRVAQTSSPETQANQFIIFSTVTANMAVYRKGNVIRSSGSGRTHS